MPGDPKSPKEPKEAANKLERKTSAPEPEPDTPIPAEILDKLPPDTRKALLTLTSLEMSGPMHPPFLKKITEEHITKIIENTEESDKREFSDARSNRRYQLAYVLIFIALFVFVIVYLSNNNPSLLKDVLVGLASFGGGFGVGYGVRTRQDH